MNPNKRIDYFDKYMSMCDDIRKKYPCISFDAFIERYCKEFDGTEVGTYSELIKKKEKLINNLKPMFDSYNNEREHRYNNAKAWIKRIMLDSVNKFSDDIVVQNKISEYLYSKASDESVTLAECWNNLDKYNIIISDILKLLADGDKDV